jgi:putative ABC transport system permease protein
MRSALRLATSNVFGRRGRTVLLTAVVAMAAALVAAVATALASVDASLAKRMDLITGRADVRVRAGSGQTLPADLESRLAGFEGVRDASAMLQQPVSVRVVRPVWEAGEGGGFGRRIRSYSTSAMGQSAGEGLPQEIRPIELLEGRLPRADDEVVISQMVAQRLRGVEGKEARRSSRLSQLTTGLLSGIQRAELPPGLADGPESAETAEEAERLTALNALGVGRESDVVEVLRFNKPALRFRVVGISRAELLGSRAMIYFTRAGLASATGQEGRATQVDVRLEPGVKAEAFVSAWGDRISEMEPDGLDVRTTERISAGFNRNRETTNMARLLASVMAFLAAAFIIMTGMATNVTERQRELAILRCIGASPWQLAESQLWSGLLIGTAGAMVGVPAGFALALGVVMYFRDELKVDVTLPGWGLAVAFGGAVLMGLVGALWPALQVARMSPLAALSIRSRVTASRTTLLISVVGLTLLGVHLGSAFLVEDRTWNFWIYIGLGLPSLFLGYFLLSVPAVVWIVRVFGGVLARVWAVPREMLGRSVAATPYRFGFTAGAMMVGLAIMVAIWTQGRSILEDWIGRLKFPDVFVLGLNLTDEHRSRIESLPFVSGTVPISLQAVETDAFGLEGLTSSKSTYIGFEPESFFELAELEWIQGDKITATARLNEGGAVLVPKEFQVARGLGVGDTISLKLDGRSATFEIVGVVTSQGLEIVSRFFDLPETYEEQAIHAVFGTRRDLRDRLKGGQEPAIAMLQVGLKPFDPTMPEEGQNIGDAEAERRIRAATLDGGVLDVGNGRRLKADLTTIITRSLLITSCIAVMSMVVACFGVANLIVAGIDARQFEFGVLRAVGAPRGLVLRLVLAEAAVVGLAAAALGTLMGIQAVFGGQHFDAALLGLSLRVRPPVIPIAAGCVIVMVITLGAAAPAVMALARKRPRELLGAVKG